MTRRNHTSIADIEALRAIAIIFTMVQHLTATLPWSSPTLSFVFGRFQFWAGVDLFFCISGFVIARSLFRSLDDGSLTGATHWSTMRAFWIRRAFRILPTAWLWLLVIVCLSVVWNTHGSFKTIDGNINDAVAAVLQFENIHKWYCSIAPHSVCGVADVYWSLSLEEQFYILLPIAILLLGRRFLIPALTIAAVLQIVTARPSGYDIWNMTKSDAIMLGVLLAWCSVKPWYAHLRGPILIVARFAVPVLLVLLLWIPAQPLYYMTGMISVTSAGLVAISSLDADVMVCRFRGLLLFVGARSYSWYLSHLPIFLVVREAALRWLPASMMNDWMLPVYIATLLALVVTISEVIYRYIEQPLRMFGVRVATRSRDLDVATAPVAAV